MKDLQVIKIGGNIIDDDEQLVAFLNDFSAVKGPKILVHGGGKMATKTAEKLGLKSIMIEGRRVTDELNLEVVVMVYAGLINKKIVARLNARQCKAIGLSGADFFAIETVKRNPVPVDYGFVGDITSASVKAGEIGQLLDMGLVPVFSAITSDADGHLLNTNADAIASGLAVALSTLYTVKLVYCFEKEGVLRSEDELISKLDIGEYDQLKATGIVYEGMIPKLDNAFNALASGVGEVWIKHARNLNITKGTSLKRP